MIYKVSKLCWTTEHFWHRSSCWLAFWRTLQKTQQPWMSPNCLHFLVPWDWQTPHKPVSWSSFSAKKAAFSLLPSTYPLWPSSVHKNLVPVSVAQSDSLYKLKAHYGMWRPSGNLCGETELNWINNILAHRDQVSSLIQLHTFQWPVSGKHLVSSCYRINKEPACIGKSVNCKPFSLLLEHKIIHYLICEPSSGVDLKEFIANIHRCSWSACTIKLVFAFYELHFIVTWESIPVLHHFVIS